MRVSEPSSLPPAAAVDAGTNASPIERRSARSSSLPEISLPSPLLCAEAVLSKLRPRLSPHEDRGSLGEEEEGAPPPRPRPRLGGEPGCVNAKGKPPPPKEGGEGRRLRARARARGSGESGGASRSACARPESPRTESTLALSSALERNSKSPPPLGLLGRPAADAEADADADAEPAASLSSSASVDSGLRGEVGDERGERARPRPLLAACSVCVVSERLAADSSSSCESARFRCVRTTRRRWRRSSREPREPREPERRICRGGSTSRSASSSLVDSPRAGGGEAARPSSSPEPGPAKSANGRCTSGEAPAI